MAGRLPGRRGRLGGARPRDRVADVGRPGPRGSPDAPADPRPAGDGAGALEHRRDGRLPAHDGCLALSPATRRRRPAAQLAPQVVGIVSRRFGDFDSAEDAVQEALLAAARHWPVDGVPDEPRAWLVTAASRRLVDLWRSDAARRERRRASSRGRCRHTTPSTTTTASRCSSCAATPRSPPSAIALTLRAVGGLTTAEIAHAFFVPEPTMAQRISRAKATIRASGEGFRMPSAAEPYARLRSALHVLYLLFNEGYASTHGDDGASEIELSREAIRLTRLLVASLPQPSGGFRSPRPDAPARGAAPARSDGSGALVPLPSRTARGGIAPS